MATVWDIRMLEILKSYFGYDAFRPLQQEIISHCVAGKDALVLMPTGGGKSLCYQIPALLLHGTTIVVSPLIALMKDQVDALRANGVPAAYLNSALSPSEAHEVERRVLLGEIKLLYLAPERLTMPSTAALFQKITLSLFAIDEAHCISEWGHDFRPEYRNLRILRERFPEVPVIALTATANPRVKEDILAQLRLREGKIFQSSFLRPNLTYRVLPKKKAFERILAEAQARPKQSIIIYCFSRHGTEKLAADLRARGIQAEAYHAGLLMSERARIQEGFIRDQIPIIVATIAFGMGIDKPDVRLVIHADLPKSIEGYYQETGRAGRDGLPSDCLLLFSSGDRVKQLMFIREMGNPAERERAFIQLQTMLKYGELETCRKKFLLEYFGEPWSGGSCGACDHCAPTVSVPLVAATGHSPSALVDFDRELFERLRGFRRALAEERGVPPYVVFSDKTLQDMSRFYPQSLASMAKIFGVGKEKLSLFGEAFVQRILAYAQEKSLPDQIHLYRRENTRPLASIAKRTSSTTIEATLRLFRERKTIQDIAALRKLSASTVLSHLEKSFEEGEKLDIAHMTFSSMERFQAIMSAFQASGGTALTPVRARLGEAYTFDELRLARFILRVKGVV